MPTYSQLANSSFTDIVVPFTTFNGLNDSSTTLSKVLTGYTLGITKFTFTPIVSALKGTYIGASLDKLIWDFGDGTTDTGFTVTKHYEYPGEFDVTMIVTDQNGVTHRNRAFQRIKISNYIPDALMWYTPTIANAQGGMPERCLCGQPSNDLTIFRYNSWQSWPVVSGDGGYFINLYSQGSRSRPLTQQQYETGPDAHYVPSWRFVKDKDSTLPVERLQTDNNQDIYVKLNPNGEVVHTSKEDPSSIFAGTSGYTTVNYIDDNANKLTSSRCDYTGGDGNLATFVNENINAQDVEARDIVLYASFDTSKFPVTRHDVKLEKYEILKKDYFQIYETQKVGLPIQVKFSTPRKLSITSNGILNFGISENKYNDSPISVSVRTCSMPEPLNCIDEQNPDFIVNTQESILATDDIVPLTSSWYAPSEAFSACDVTTDVITGQGYVTMYLSGEDSDFYDVRGVVTDYEDYKVWDVATIKPATQASSYVRLLLTKHDGTHIPSPTGRVISLLTTQLADGSKQLLSTVKRRELVYGTGKPNWWETKSGTRYYAYLAPDSKYELDESVEMDIIDAPLTTDTYGAYTSYLNLKTNTNIKDYTKKYRILATTLIDPPLYFNYDVLYYYLSNPSNDIIHQIKPVYYRTYSYGDQGFTQSYPSPLKTTTPGNSGLYGFAVDPTGNMITVDGDTDRIIRHWRNQTVRNEIDVYSLLPDVSAYHYPGDNDEYGYSPSSVSFDECLDYWVTLYDTVSTIKLNGQTNELMAVAVPPVENMLIDSRTTAPSTYWTDEAEFARQRVYGPQGEYGENLIKPTIVETCKNNDIVVTYTNPVCSFISRFNTSGEHIYKYELGKDRYFTGDVCIDSSDHIWAVTEGTGLLADGQVDLDPPRSELYAFNEELSLRFSVSTLSGTEYQDMQAPIEHTEQQIDFLFNMNQFWDPVKQRYVAENLLVDGYDTSFINPKLKIYEGNLYTFKNMYYNNGEHAMTIHEIDPEELATIPLSADSSEFSYTGDLWNLGITGLNYGDESDVKADEIIYLRPTKDFPKALILVDYNNPQNRLILEIIPKPVIYTREAETFDMINNMSHVIPDNNNNIWFSWGKRFCSRYNITDDTVDSTVAVGSAYHDPRYHPLSADLHDRRDNADRRSSIEGLSMDTGNNLLVVNNCDKRLYALNSETPTCSAYIEIDHYQIPYKNFSWVESISSDSTATEQDFLAPSYLTDEQIQVFLSNTNRGNTQSHRVSAYNEYIKTMQGANGDIKFRTCHGANPVSATGFEEEIRAGGDWTGYRWINKYDNRIAPSDATTGLVSLTGISDEFTLIPQTGTHDIVKVGEDIDFAGVIREYMQQPSMREKEKLYDEFLNVVFGTVGSSSEALGKRVYEKISNYVDNHADLDRCTVNALYGLAEMVNYKIEKFDTPLPAELKQKLDLLSIKLTSLIGEETNFQQDFDKLGNHAQQSVGVNLGPELMFVLDYDPSRSYPTGDYVYYEGEYYRSRKIIKENSPPSLEDTTNWTHFPGGLVKYRTYSDMRLGWQNKTDAEIETLYYEQPTIIKLIQNIKLDISQKYVLHEEFSSEYRLVRPMAITYPEFTDLAITNTEAGFLVTDPNNRLDAEVISDNTYTNPTFTIKDNVMTIIDRGELENPTINLFRGRTYEIDIDSPGHPVYITTQLGVSSSALLGYVANQGTEFGKMVLRTYDDPLYAPLPDTIYYQSGNDPKRSGVIRINEIKDLDGYSNQLNGLSSYNLNITVSSHDILDPMGWGMEFPDNMNAWQYYRLYEYKPDANTAQEFIGNVINWGDPGTTNTRTYDISRQFEEYPDIKFDNAAYKEWTRDGGDMDIMFEKTLRKGLGLFSGVSSLSNYVTGK